MDHHMTQLTQASYGSALFTLLSSVSFERWVTILSLCLAILTFAINWYYKHKEYEHRVGNNNKQNQDDGRRN